MWLIRSSESRPRKFDNELEMSPSYLSSHYLGGMQDSAFPSSMSFRMLSYRHTCSIWFREVKPRSANACST